MIDPPVPTSAVAASPTASHTAGPLATFTRDYATYRRVFSGQPMPFAYVDLDLFDQNVQTVLALGGTKRIRIASKSVRSVTMLRRILAADPRFQGIMCYTAREAVWLASQGFTDLLIGYPTVHPDELALVATAVRAGAAITFMVDSVAHIERIAAAARASGTGPSGYTTLAVCLEVDLSVDVPGLHFGVWRSPLRTPEQARPILAAINATAGAVRLEGLMGYEAQIAGVGDALPGQWVKNHIVRALKRHSLQVAATRRTAMVDLVTSMGMDLRFVNGGGTGSLQSTRAEAVVTEITVGSGFYSPALFDNYRDFRFLPAAGYAMEIVRRPAPHIYTCLGGGYVASGALGREKLPRPYLPAGAKLIPSEDAGEVQTPIFYQGPEHLNLGDPIFLRHSKAGEICEHFQRLLLVADNQIVGDATTYRGDGQLWL